MRSTAYGTSLEDSPNLRMCKIIDFISKQESRSPSFQFSSAKFSILSSGGIKSGADLF
jgi:hypothetical protein